MLTQEQVLSAIKAGRESQCLDERDYFRLSSFFPLDQWVHFGASLKGGFDPPVPRDWTEDLVKDQLHADVLFGIEKAEDERGISSDMMYHVVKMWLWLLEDDLQHHSDYHSYGLPFFKEVKAKYSGDSGVHKS